MADWHDNLIDDAQGIAQLWADTRRVAVLGIKTEAQSGQPAYYVPQYLADAGVDVPPHLDDLLAAKPAAVWMQSGISHPQVAQRLAEAGIKVVQDRCAMVEHRRHVR